MNTEDVKIPIINQRSEILDLVPHDVRRVLDVGCGQADVALTVKRRFDCEVTGIEIDKAKASIAASRIDRVITADAASLEGQLSPGYFDCIIFADVLEHLKDPCGLLKWYKRYLKKGGSMVISVPNVRNLKVLFELIFAGEWEYRAHGILDEGHLRFFTLKSFRRLMYEARVTPICMKRIFSIKGSGLMNMLTLGLFRDFFTGQYVFLAKDKETT